MEELIDAQPGKQEGFIDLAEIAGEFEIIGFLGKVVGIGDGLPDTGTQRGHFLAENTQLRIDQFGRFDDGAVIAVLGFIHFRQDASSFRVLDRASCDF